jgi:hypothetical protein
VRDPAPRRHPRNVDFAWRPVHREVTGQASHCGGYRRITATQARDFDRDGYFVIRNGIGAALRRLAAEVDRLMAPVQRSGDGPTARRSAISTLIRPHLVTLSPWLRHFCASALFCDLAEDLLGPSVRLYWDQAVYKTNADRAGEFLLHQDNGRSYIEPQSYLTCWIALTDATPVNGCLWMLPGYHTLGMLEHDDTAAGLRLALPGAVNAVPVEARAGDVVVFSSLTPHRSGPNTSPSTRKAYVVQYALDGSVVSRDPLHGIGTDLTMNDPDRQYLIVRDGRAVAHGKDSMGIE